MRNASKCSLALLLLFVSRDLHSNCKSHNHWAWAVIANALRIAAVVFFFVGRKKNFVNATLLAYAVFREDIPIFSESLICQNNDKSIDADVNDRRSRASSLATIDSHHPGPSPSCDYSHWVFSSWSPELRSSDLRHSNPCVKNGHHQVSITCR